jgi:hypothetical protein
MITAAIVSIPGSIACVLSLLGAYDSLKFAWMRPLTPYLYSCIACAVLLWFITFALDYLDVRRAASTKHPTVDFNALLATERTETERLLTADRTERDRLIDCVNYKVDNWLQRTNETLNSLIPKPTIAPPLKQRIMQLHDRLGVFEQEYEKKSDIQQESSESSSDFITRKLQNAIQESVQMSADFRIQFENDMRTLNDQIELRSGQPFLAAIIDQAARACHPKSIKEMREQLWECARTMEK